jgi:hypothetical protein
VQLTATLTAGAASKTAAITAKPFQQMRISSSILSARRIAF